MAAHDALYSHALRHFYSLFKNIARLTANTLEIGVRRSVEHADLVRMIYEARGIKIAVGACGRDARCGLCEHNEAAFERRKMRKYTARVL